VHSRKIKDKELTFGVSGLLYKSNVLMYDHQTESLWSQVKGNAVTGPMTGTPLNTLPSTLTTWGKWKKRFPDTKVLTTDTGYLRDYTRDPYEDYYKRKKGLFSFFNPGPGEEEKQLVAGVTINGTVKAYPLETLRRKGTITDQLGNREITIIFNTKTDELEIHDKKGNDVTYLILYWFVWKGIHPDSTIFRLK
jgi:hypothetical protein